MKIWASVIMVGLVLSRASSACADVDSDLWRALKGANDAEALAAIAKGPNVRKLDPVYGTPLNYAAAFAGAPVVKALIDAKSEVNFVHPANKYTPLANAAHWGNLEALKLLLAAGASVKMKNVVGQPLLAIALNSCRLDVLKTLVDAGANPKETWRMPGPPVDSNLLGSIVTTYSPAEKVKNLKDNYPTMQKGGLTLPARLLNAKESDFTPLEEYTRYLLEKGGFDPNQVVPGFGPVLIRAVELGKAGVVQALIEAKANLNVTMRLRGKATLFDAKPLMVAAAKGHNAIVEMLLAAGAPINEAATENGQEMGNANTVVLRGSRTPHTAYSLALDNKHPDTAAILRKAGGLAPGEGGK